MWYNLIYEGSKKEQEGGREKLHNLLFASVIYMQWENPKAALAFSLLHVSLSLTGLIALMPSHTPH